MSYKRKRTSLVLIVANGEPPSVHRLQEAALQADTIIAADGGARICRETDVRPHYIIGDLDSFSDELQAQFNETRIIHKPSQYATDMEKALALAHECNPHRIKIFGALGKRQDQSVCNLLFFSAFDPSIHLEIYDSYGKHTILPPGVHTFRHLKGKTVSLYAVQPVRQLTLRGFRYDLEKQDFEPYFAGVSNVAESEQCIIEFEQGTLFMYEVDDE